MVKAGRHQEAEPHFQNLGTAAIAAKELDLAARAIGNAGGCQFALHRYGEAAQSFLKAHALAESAGDANVAAIFEANLASLYSEMGELDSAVLWTERSLERMTGADRRAHLPELQIQLASLRARQGRLPEAVDLFRQAIQLADRDRNFALYAMGWNRLGEELMRHEEYQQAERAFLESFRVRSLRGLPLDVSYTNLGKVRLEMGDLESASELLDRANELSAAPQRVPARDVYRARGQVRLRQGRLEEAVEDLRTALRLERAWRWAGPASDAARMGAEKVLSDAHGAFIEAGNRLHLRTGGAALVRETFEAAEENRAQSLRLAMRGGADRPEEQPPAYWQAIARLQRAEMEVLRGGDAAEARAARAELVRLEAGSPAEAAIMPGGLLDEVQGTLPRGSSIVAFHLGDAISWRWAVDRDAIALDALPGAAEIRRQVAAAAGGVHENRTDAAAALYTTLFGSVPARFRDNPRWLLALDTDLFDAPLAALVDESGSYLAERRTIEIIPGAGAWIEAARHPGPASNLFVGVGDPIYNTADPRLGNQQPAADALLLPRLVGSGAEVEACARSWKGDHVLLRGGDVSRDRLRDEMQRGPAVLHFATHFLESSERSGAAMVALGMSEVLPAAEISRWNLRLGLVVLSGCRSAGGAAWRGSGLLGLTRAWLAAGARSVVGSRWATPDEDGALFRSMYHHLRAAGGRDAAAALQAAQIDMLRAGGWRARPDYWGAYFVMGSR